MGHNVSAIAGVKSPNFYEQGNAINEIWVDNVEVISRLPFGDSDLGQAGWPKGNWPKIPWHQFIIPLKRDLSNLPMSDEGTCTCSISYQQTGYESMYKSWNIWYAQIWAAFLCLLYMFTWSTLFRLCSWDGFCESLNDLMPPNLRTPRPISQIPLDIRTHREANILFMRWYFRKAMPRIFIGPILLFFARPAATLYVGHFPINYAFRTLVTFLYSMHLTVAIMCALMFYFYKKAFESREIANALEIVPVIPPQTVTVALVGIIQVPDVAYQS
ncbi:hypothetical protein N7488_011857 [Penicillium malachiteum]|nr:hypothetical protein N7488_011857 [Penicillium malachiteum]